MAIIQIEDKEVEIVSADEFCDLIKDKVSKENLLAITDLILEKLKEYEIVETPFGRFSKTIHEARISRHPQTGESIQIPARTMLRWHATPNMQVGL